MKLLMILVGLLFAASASAAGQAAPSGRGVQLPTRNVMIFSELENAWLGAVQKRDTKSLDKLVADNFELRTSAAPGVPTAREESLRQALQLPPFESSIGQMAVHEFGDLMLVSFLWKIDAPKGSGLAQNVFVVDTWRRNADSWQVVVRYASPVDEASAAVPGAVAPSAQSLRKKM
jgi:ketosteroid isomerase-like protein